MKKILMTLVCIMAAMSTMGLSAQDNAKNLTPGQWKHGLAVGAQWIATDLGFAQSEAQVISRTNENYSLDDLKTMYGSREKWVDFYNKLKAHENETGDIDKLLETISAEYDKGALIKGGVKRDVEKYNASHTGDEVGTASSQEPTAEASSEGTTTVTNASDSTASQEQDKASAEKEESGSHGGHGFLYLLAILGLAAGVIGAFLAMQARKESQAMARDVRDDVNNMQKQIDKLRAALKGEQPVVHAKSAKHDNKLNETAGLASTKKIEFDNKPAQKNDPKKDVKKEEPKNEPKKEVKKEEPKKEEPKKEEPKKEEPKATVLGEPRILFMAKPDENDNFSRSSSQYEPGNSIFELTTMDGKSGSFTVINKNDAHKLALLMPGDTLTRACSGNNIQSSAGKSRIITDRAGRAQLENGKWHIVVKAIIHYE
ncbi:MAG: hypothetical protein IJ925_02520 [Muribaculaceae bacterium]|nr:hypothetical protein [Muribaculaceae bacterium]